MLTQEEITKINYYAKKKKAEGLTSAEAAEQQMLRQKYIADVKSNVRSQLDQTVAKKSTSLKHDSHCSCGHCKH